MSTDPYKLPGEVVVKSRFRALSPHERRIADHVLLRRLKTAEVEDFTRAEWVFYNPGTAKLRFAFPNGATR